jgi:hypothetical protein
VSKLVSEEKLPGSCSRHCNGEGLSSGAYFYRFQAGSYIETKKLVIIKQQLQITETKISNEQLLRSK